MGTHGIMCAFSHNTCCSEVPSISLALSIHEVSNERKNWLIRSKPSPWLISLSIIDKEYTI